MAGADGAFAGHGQRTLLESMITARRTGIKVGCRSGGCGVCRIRITDGKYRSLKMSRSRISEQDEAEGIVLACRVFPESDISLEAMPLNVKVVS